MINSFEKLLAGKVLISFFICFCFLQSTLQAQVKHTKPTITKLQPQAQMVSEPPNPYADIDKTALLLPDSLTKSTEVIAAYIKANFHSNEDKVRAAFIWVVSNIRYDVPNMYAINYYEKKEDKIAKPLQTRQGICENYAALFTDICEKAGIPGFVVQGYVKINNQVPNISHAWSVARIDTGWYLFDPTWAAGYINNGVFVPKINNTFYKAGPSNFIQAHMPFDPLWQLLYHPVSFTDFNNGPVKEDSARAFFNFSDSIALYEKQNENERNQASYIRIDNNGARNTQVFNQLLYIRQMIEQSKIDQYNEAIAEYNNAVVNFNEFIRYRNKQFIPMRPDVEIQAMLDSAIAPYKLAKMKLSQIKSPGPDIKNMMGPIQKQMNDFSEQLEEQETWLVKYSPRENQDEEACFIQKSIGLVSR